MDSKGVVTLPIDISYLNQLFKVIYPLAVEEIKLRDRSVPKLTKEDNP